MAPELPKKSETGLGTVSEAAALGRHSLPHCNSGNMTPFSGSDPSDFGLFSRPAPTPVRYPELPESPAIIEEPTKAKFLRATLFNARSLRNKFAHLPALQKDKDLIFVTETWLKENDPSPANIADEFDIHRKDRGTRGGGVMAAVRKLLPVRRRSDMERSDLELM